MAKFFNLLSKLISTVIFSISLLFCTCTTFMISLSSIKNLEITEYINNTIVNISQIHIDISTRKFSINFGSVKLGKTSKSDALLQMASGGHITTDMLNLLEFALFRINRPIIDIKVDDIDIIAAINLNKDTSTVMRNRGSPKDVVNNLIRLSKKQYIQNLKALLTFKYQSIEEIPTIRKLAISGCNASECISQIRVDYTLNGKDGSIYSLVNAEVSKSQPSKWKLLNIFKKKDYERLLISIYGYAEDLAFKISTYNFLIDDFVRLSLTYDLNTEKISFHGRAKNFISELSPSYKIDLRDIAFRGGYNLWNEHLEVTEATSKLVTDQEEVNLNAKLKLFVGKSWELSVHSNDRFSRDIVFKYWPNELSPQLRENLENLITQGYINRPTFYIKALLRKNNSILSLNSDFTLETAVLKRQLNETMYVIEAPRINVHMDEKHAFITSNNMSLNGLLPVEKFAIDVPFKSVGKTAVVFDVRADGSALKDLAHDLKMGFSFGDGGDINVKSTIAIPYVPNLTWRDMIFSFKSNINNIEAKYENRAHRISSKNLHLTIDKGIANVQGDITYNNILFDTLNFKGWIRNNRLANWSVDLALQTHQRAIQDIIKETQTDLHGTAKIHGEGKGRSSRISVDCTNTNIQNATLLLNKENGAYGRIAFTMLDNQFKDIDIDLLDVIARGELTLDKGKKNLTHAEFNFTKFHNNKFNFIYSKPNATSHEYRVNADVINIDEISEMLAKQKKTTPSTMKASNDKHSVVIAVKEIHAKSEDILHDLKARLIFEDGKLKKLDGAAYNIYNNSYIHAFLDVPIFALVVNDVGQIFTQATGMKSLKKGTLSLYGTITNLDNLSFSGDVHMQNFKLMESYLLSTILRVYSLSGHNILNLIQNGVQFYDSHCDIALEDNVIMLRRCRAVADSLLMGLDAEFDFTSKHGRVEGNIIPKSIFNLPLIAFYRIFTKSGANILDTFEGRQNFGIILLPDRKPIIQTNPVSFLLPSVFGYFLSKRQEKRQAYSYPMHATQDKSGHSSDAK